MDEAVFWVSIDDKILSNILDILMMIADTMTLWSKLIKPGVFWKEDLVLGKFFMLVIDILTLVLYKASSIDYVEHLVAGADSEDWKRYWDNSKNSSDQIESEVAVYQDFAFGVGFVVFNWVDVSSSKDQESVELWANWNEVWKVPDKYWIDVSINVLQVGSHLIDNRLFDMVWVFSVHLRKIVLIEDHA